MEKMNIVFSSDDNYSQHLGLVIKSILDNKLSAYNINFYVLDGGISKQNKENINSLLKKGNDEIFFISIDKEKFKGFPERRHLKLSAYYRLLAPYIIDCDRLLYLDCDLLVLDDLRSLFDMDLGDNVIAAAKDRSEYYIKKYYFRNIQSYFNSGVLLINTKKWQEENILEKAKNFLEKEKNIRKIKYADQDILNHLLESKWKQLDKSFNYQLDIYQKGGNINGIKVLHYVGKIKPWHYLYANNYQKYYLECLNNSPWKDYNFPDYSFSNVFKKKGDKIIHEIRLIIQTFIPKRIVLKIKDISLYFNNRRDSR